MSDLPITIQRGLPDDQRERAATIYYDAFGRKFRSLVDRAQALRILAAGMEAERAIVALQAGQVIGLAGLHYDGRHFVYWRWGDLRRECGFMRGAINFLLLGIADRHPAEGQLLMDGLAVAASGRGQGVGSLLLEAVCDFARERGDRAVRLDVVDTNPRARALYERRGFVATETHRLPGFLREPLGFGAYTTMIRQV